MTIATSPHPSAWPSVEIPQEFQETKDGEKEQKNQLDIS